MKVPGGGASCLGVGRPGSGAPPPPTTRPFGRAAGAHYPLAVGAGGADVGTRHQPHSARSCELALRAVGAARGRPGQGGLLPGFGASRVGRSPTPNHSSFPVCGQRPLPTCCWCGGWGRGDPSPTPRRALLRGGFALCWGGMRVPGGGAPLALVWGVRGRALSYPRPLVLSGVRPGPTTHWLWVQGPRAWQPVINPTACAFASCLVRCGGGMGVHGKGRLQPGCGASRVGRFPNLNLSSFRACSRGPLPTGCGCGGCGRGDPSPTPQRMLLRAALRAVGAARGRPGGAPLAWVWGVQGRALSHPRRLVLSGVGPGPTTHWLWVRCADRVARLSLAPFPAPRFVTCCARFPGLGRQVAVVA